MNKIFNRVFRKSTLAGIYMYLFLHASASSIYDVSVLNNVNITTHILEMQESKAQLIKNSFILCILLYKPISNWEN